jgi:hypothetical protein
VVPREHPVVEPDDEIGQRQIVVSRRRKPFERQAPVVGDVTGSATLKRRQSRQGLGRVRGDELAQRDEPIAANGPGPAGRSVETLRVHAATADDGNGIGRDEGIAAESAGGAGAIEKQTVGQAFERGATIGRIRRGNDLLDERRHRSLRSPRLRSACVNRT